MKIIHPSKFDKESIIVFSIKVKNVNWSILQQLKNQSICADEKDPAAMTVACFSAFRLFEYKLNGSAADAFKNKFSEASIDYQNDEIIIMVRSQNDLTSAIKVVKLFVQYFAPEKLKTSYKNYIMSLGQKFEDNVFDACCHEICEGMNDVDCFITGKIKEDSAKEKVIADLLKEMPKLHKCSKSSAKVPVSKVNFEHTIKCSDVKDCYIKQSFLRYHHISCNVVDNQLVFYTAREKDIAGKKISKEAIKKYMESKFDKLKDKLDDVLRVFEAATGYISPKHLR